MSLAGARNDGRPGPLKRRHNGPMDAPFVRTQLRALGVLLPTLESPEFSFGRWEGGERLPNGTTQVPYYTLSDEAERFRAAAAPLLLPQFDWPAWTRTAEFERFDREPGAIAGASAVQVQQLLTVYIRSERFGDGTLERAFERGVLTAIVRRAGELEASADGPPVP